MNLAPSPDQRAIKEAFADVFRRESAPERVRAAAPSGFDPRLWSLLCELGAVGIAVDDDIGGAGAGLLELVLVAEEAGRRLACVPLVEAAVAARVLARAGAAAGDLLAGALSGELLVVFAPRRADQGVAALAPGGAVADAIVALDGDDLVVARSAPGTAVPDLGFAAVADRRLDGAGVERHVLLSGLAARERWSDAVAEWRIATGGLLAGLAAEAIAIAVDYTTERVQFGVPVGSFQAVQHELADVVTAADGAELLARDAAWRRDQDIPSWRRLAPMVYAHAGAVAERAARAGLHFHGGYGYTLEYDIQLYLRRAKGLALAGGDPERLWEEIGMTAVAEA